jgi:hypothetical protein
MIKGKHRTIESKFFRETFTQYDPESRDRKSFPVSDRRGLFDEGDQTIMEYLISRWEDWSLGK